MASIGELTATVRADVSGYVTPMRAVVSTNKELATSVKTNNAALTRIGQTVILVSNQMAGFGGQVGSLASKLGLLAGGGGIMFAVGAAVAAIGYAFNKATESARKHGETIDDLVRAYQDATGATVRLRLEEARVEQARMAKGTLKVIGVGAMGLPMVTRFADTQELTRANQALLQAQKEYDDWMTQQHAPAMRRAAEAAREAARANREFVEALKNASKIDTEANTAKKVSALTKEAQAWRLVKAEIVAAQEAERARANDLPGEIAKGKQDDTKDIFRQGQEGAVQGARDAANTLASAFSSAFRDQEGNLMETIASTLKRAIMDALEKILAQKLFEGFLSLATGGASKGITGGVTDIVGNIFGAPSVPMPSASGMTVNFANFPPPRGPVEMARDVFWQGVLVESLRQAQSNGANTMPRRR